jgi:thioredoxin 2
MGVSPEPAVSIHIACPQCLATNRVPEDRLEAAPRCGRCSQPLFAGKVASVDAEGFEAMLARNDLPVLVDFWAPWCGPCVSMAPHLETAARQLEPRVRVIKVDIQAHPEIGQRHAIQSIPTLAVFGGGRELGRRSGASGAQAIVSWVVPVIMAS